MANYGGQRLVLSATPLPAAAIVAAMVPLVRPAIEGEPAQR